MLRNYFLLGVALIPNSPDKPKKESRSESKTESSKANPRTDRHRSNVARNFGEKPIRNVAERPVCKFYHRNVIPLLTLVLMREIFRISIKC